jgi:hypothetical protein
MTKYVGSPALRWVLDGSEGVLWVDGNGTERALPIPVDAQEMIDAGTPYALVALADRPAWRLLVGGEFVVEGLGTSLGTSLGED